MEKVKNILLTTNSFSISDNCLLPGSKISANRSDRWARLIFVREGVLSLQHEKHSTKVLKNEYRSIPPRQWLELSNNTKDPVYFLEINYGE